MIPEEHLPAVDRACVDIIDATYSTQANVPDMMIWIRERLRTFYEKEVE